MGIVAEFNPDLALRNFEEFRKGNRGKEECIPEFLVKGEIHDFLKEGQRFYYISDDPIWDFGEIPLFITKGEGNLSRPIASIKILEATHFLKNGKVWTKGKYKIVNIFDINNKKINFEWMKRVE